MAEVGVAVLADDLRALHEEAVVGAQLDVLEVGRLGEAGPAGAGVELGAGGEKLGATADTDIHAVGLLVYVWSREGSRGAGIAGHVVLLGRQLVAPLSVGLLDFGHGRRVGGGHRGPLPTPYSYVRPVQESF